MYALIFFTFISLVGQLSKGCTSITLKGLSVGYAKITATHRYGDVVIQDSIHIAVYKPVKVFIMPS